MADEIPSSFSAGRKWMIGFNVFVAAIAAIAVGAMLNYLAARHYWRFRWLVHGQTEIAPQTERILRSLTNNVRITVFFDSRSREESQSKEDLQNLVTALLKEYNYLNPKIIFKTVDPTRHPGEAELVLAAYKLSALKDKNFVVIDCDGRSKVIYETELGDFKYEPVPNTQPVQYRKRLTGFRGQMLFTDAIFNLANPRQFKVCFLQGHGEHDPEKLDDDFGYAKFAAVLKERCNVQWEKLWLAPSNGVPADCQLLIVAGSRLPLEDAELKQIESYLKQGGRLFALLSSMAREKKKTGLETILGQWNVSVGDNFIFDPQYSPTGTGKDLLTAWLSPQHAVTKGLFSDSEDLRVRLVLPRAVGRLQATTSPDAPKVELLAATGKEATEASDIREGVAYRNYQDRQGIFPLIVAVEQGSVRGVEPGSTRMVVVGDSLCLDNQLIDSVPANHYFAALAADWLLNRPQVLLEGLVPAPLKDYRLAVTREQMQTLQWVLLGGMPGTVLLLGGLVWWRRRK